MNVEFLNPAFLSALLLAPLTALLFFYVIRWKKKTISKIGDERLVLQLIKGYSPVKFFLKFLGVVLALATIIVAIADPGKSGVMDKVERKGVDVMIALDVSNSMLAADIKPNRLEKAKQMVNRLVSQLDNDRVGLVVFAGRAYMQMPLTLDHAAARMYIQNAGPQMVPTQGTMISEALKLSASAFNSKERKYKAIILITDGEDHDPASLQTAEQLAANGVMVNTVGIGSALGTPIPDPATGQYRKDEAGNTVLSKLNEGQLKELASITRGVYVQPDEGDGAVSAIMKRLSTIQETALEDSAFKDHIHYFQWFIFIALALLIVEFLLPETKKNLEAA
ncbi:MAG: VWA domain-containing protein [Flavitalea sp.]